MLRLPDWSSVKHDPDARMEYHKLGHEIAVEQMENLTREILADPSKATSNAIQVVRLIADSMTKSFNQMYYDAMQGFPKYRPAEWLKNADMYDMHGGKVSVIPGSEFGTVNGIELSKAELMCIVEAIYYADDQISSSNGDIQAYRSNATSEERVEQAKYFDSVCHMLIRAMEDTDNVIIKTVG